MTWTQSPLHAIPSLTFSLTHMIAHHEGAVEMAEDVLATTSNGRVTDLANAIISAQNAEIDEMKRLLETTP